MPPIPILSPELVQTVDDVPDASLVVGESGTILFTNRQVGHLFGYAPGELHGLSIELLMPARFRLPHISSRLSFTDHRRTRPMGTGLKLSALCKDGSERPVEISLSPVQHGLETLIVAVIRDVAELK